jgi:hypothetical protein
MAAVPPPASAVVAKPRAMRLKRKWRMIKTG